MASGKVDKFSDHDPSNGPNNSGEKYAGNSSTVGSHLLRQTRTNKLRNSPAGQPAQRTSPPEVTPGSTPPTLNGAPSEIRVGSETTFQVRGNHLNQKQ
uniref:Zinc finger protein n=1 Tax=Solanum tuberosum TaxID=4113 RepID=M1AW80_SOLTU